MEKLKHEAVTRLIDRAVTAGNTNPSLTQLQTLALALGDRPGWEFLRHATLKDRVAIRNCVAATVYGKDPVKVCEGVGALFGMAGEDAVIAEATQERIYDVKPVERTTEDQKNINERKQVPQEEKHPLTSDRAAPQPAVAEPLKEQTDPKFKEILNRGEKHLTEIAKETAPAKGIKASIKGIAASVASVFAGRIKQGERVEQVLADYASAITAPPRPVFAVINAGDRITMSTPATGPVDVTFEAGNMTPTGGEQLVGKDGLGNVVMVLPKGTDPMQIKDMGN